MAWDPLATQFCLELAFGVLVSLALIPRAPMGVFFFRLMGTTALIPMLLAGCLSVAWGGRRFSDPEIWLLGPACLAFPIYSGPVRAAWRLPALLLSATFCAASLGFALGESAVHLVGPFQRLTGTLSALATGAVAGGVGTAMVVGHWYLTVPQLPVAVLARVNRGTLLAMGASVALVTALILQNQAVLAEAETPLLSPFGLFHLGSRVAVGLFLPLLFGWMTGAVLRYQNTRSATGILYASTVLVLIGAAASLSLQDTYGIPL